MVFLKLFGLALILFVLGCEKVIQPNQENLPSVVNLSVNPVYYNSKYNKIALNKPTNDSLFWEANLAYKISFQKKIDTWSSKDLSSIVIYNIYRRSINSENKVIVQRCFGKAPSGLLIQDSTYTYRDALGKIESITYTDSDFVYDIINDRTSESFIYGVAAITNLQINKDGADFAYGFVNKDVFFNEALTAKPPMFISINNGSSYTEKRDVFINGLFDTTAIDTIYLYRYSEYFLLKNFIYLMPEIANHRHDTISIRVTPAEVLKIIDSTELYRSLGGGPLDSLYGRLGTVTKIAKNDFSSFFSESFSIDNKGMASFSFYDSLSPFGGKKWIIFRPVSSDTNRKLWGALNDYIQIAPYVASLTLDLAASGISYEKNEFEKTICLLSDSIPVQFNTYGDQTFSSNIVIWLATRNLSADFYDDKLTLVKSNWSNGTGYRLEKVFHPVKDSLNVPDCILESPPTYFTLNSNGLISESNRNLTVNFDSNFHVSPLAYYNTAFELPNPLPTKQIKAGSYLGYDLSELDAPTTLDKGSWHTAIRNTSDLNALINNWTTGNSGLSGVQAKKIADSIWVEKIFSFDGIPYLNPMRNLPNNVPTAYQGVKEFILIAYTTGKYFGEPRVIISRQSSQYKYVWDKLPPHIVWSSEYDPLKAIYSPIYYTNPVRITDLSELGNIFNVWLDPNPSTSKVDGDFLAGIRDAGAGRIKSATLHCRPVSAPLGVIDPLTGLRQAGDAAFEKTYVLDKKYLDSQKFTYYGKSGSYYAKKSYGIFQASFGPIDASQWQKGLWEIWIETEDDLGNKGVAPFGGRITTFDRSKGAFIKRQIEIK